MTENTTTQTNVESSTPETLAVVPPVAVAATQSAKIDQAINAKVQAAIVEMNAFLKERGEVIEGAWVGRISQEHLLMLGPGGTGKSLLARTLASHIDDSVYFEVAVDETTDPSQVFGPPDIKAMVEDGKTRRVPTGMLPEATDAFIDEFFNANGPLLHSIMPALNERVFHNNGQPSSIPLRQMLAGTNKLNADADQAALWDRIHLRYVVGYVGARQAQAEMVGDAIARMALNGRGVSTNIAGQQKTLLTLAELDQAHAEALSLDIPDVVIDTFFDIRDELAHGAAAVQISDRRAVEGMAAVMANAWLRNHDEVKVGDLDILANMWWTVQDQMTAARGVILGATNPGEKAALDLLDELDKLKKEIKQANDSDLDLSRKKRIGVESVKNTDKLLGEAAVHLAKAEAAGASTARLKEVMEKADAFKVEVGRTVFNLDPAAMQNLSNATK
jgi:MoxR-like ATPase